MFGIAARSALYFEGDRPICWALAALATSSSRSGWVSWSLSRPDFFSASSAAVSASCASVAPSATSCTSAGWAMCAPRTPMRRSAVAAWIALPIASAAASGSRSSASSARAPSSTLTLAEELPTELEDEDEDEGPSPDLPFDPPPKPPPFASPMPPFGVRFGDPPLPLLGGSWESSSEPRWNCESRPRRRRISASRTNRLQYQHGPSPPRTSTTLAPVEPACLGAQV